MFSIFFSVYHILPMAHNGASTLQSVDPIARLPKIGGCRRNFSTSAEVFDRGSFKTFTQPRLQIARGRHSCNPIDGDLVEIQRLFGEFGFSIFLQ